MRIAYLFMKYPIPVQTFAISEVELLKKLGHRVDVYALSPKDAEHDAATEAYGLEYNPGAHVSWRTALAAVDPRNLTILLALLKVIFTRLITKPKEFVTALALAPRIVEVVAILRRDPPDVIHPFWGHYPSLVLLLAERFVPSAKRSIALTAYDLTSHLFSLSGEISRRCVCVLTTADRNLALLEAIGAPMDRVHLVYKGVPTDLADGPAPARIPGRIVSAANFQKEKNMDLVLRAFAALRRVRPEVSLRLIGDGEERAALEALADELGLDRAAVFAGLLPRQAVFDEMASAEVFLFLSTKVSERIPNVVMEALLAQCFCVVSRTTDIDALVEDGRTGFILDDLDPEAVAARVAEALDRTDRAETGRAGAEHIRANFSAQAAVEAYVAVWEAALAEERAAPRAAA